VPLLSGAGRVTVSENIRRLIHEGYPVRQAAAITYREARKSGMEAVTIPRGSGGRRHPADVAHARGLALEVQAGRYGEGAHHARKLAELRGQPQAWPVLYDAAVRAAGTHDATALVPLNYASDAERHASGGASSALATFYDAHPKTLNTVVATTALVGGLRLNARFPEGVHVGPLHAKASTWAGLATLGLALGARAFAKPRTARVAASATVGFGLATTATRLAGSAPAQGGSGPGL
jgi:hypothetical protein